MTFLLLYLGVLIIGVAGFLYTAYGSNQSGDGLSGFIPFWLSAILVITGAVGVLTYIVVGTARLNKYGEVIAATPLVLGLIVFLGFFMLIFYWQISYTRQGYADLQDWAAQTTTVISNTFLDQGISFTYADHSSDTMIGSEYERIVERRFGEEVRLFAETELTTTIYGRVLMTSIAGGVAPEEELNAAIGALTKGACKVVKLAEPTYFALLPSTSSVFELVRIGADSPDFETMPACREAVIAAYAESVPTTIIYEPLDTLFFIADPAINKILLVAANGYYAPLKAVDHDLRQTHSDAHANRWYTSISLSEPATSVDR